MHEKLPYISRSERINIQKYFDDLPDDNVLSDANRDAINRKLSLLIDQETSLIPSITLCLVIIVLGAGYVVSFLL